LKDFDRLTELPFNLKSYLKWTTTFMPYKKDHYNANFDIF